MASYRAALAIRERLAKTNPGNADWQRDLSVSHMKIGDVRVAQGDRPGALASYQGALAIAERLAQADPGNVGWQRDLSIAHERIGDVQVAQGDRPGALASYQATLAIAERLAQADPGNVGWQRDLIVSFAKLNEVTGDRAYAERALSLALAMQQRGMLAPRDTWMIEDLKRRAGR